MPVPIMLTRSGLRGQSFLAPLFRRGFASTVARHADFTHAVIGAGAVGLAVARKLAETEGSTTILIERNYAIGLETSSRNSEVIHAGLYYGLDSLKTELCIRGKEMLYDLCKKHGIPYKNCGKWVVAQTDQQWEELTKVHKFSKLVGVPTEFVAIDEAAKLEPFVRAKTGILDSPTTGIVDSHHYMQFLLSSFLDSGRGDLALNSTVTKVEPLPSQTPGDCGWKLTILDKSTNEPITITAETIINSAGLAACDISNMILPAPRHVTPYYAKGNYFSYSGSTPSTHRLIYPAPEPGLGGLGTHLTFDISGHIRFGPDVEWIDDPSDVAVSAARLPAAIKEIKKYLPDVDESKLVPDYAGIRPKLGKGASVANVSTDGTTKGDPSRKRGGIGGDGGGFIDFVIRKEEGFEGFVNLLGIESPGLTSSLAIAERVKGLLYR